MVPQDLLRIDLALRDGSFFENAGLLAACAAAKRRGATLHLMGLLSDGGVHSHERHLFGLLALAAKQGVPPRPGPRVHRRTRYAAEIRAHVPPAARRSARRFGRPDRHGLGALLRHGPRQAVGPRGARLPGPGLLVRAPGRERREPPSRPPTRAASRTSSFSRRSSRRRASRSARSATATPWSSSTSAPTGPASSPAR